jgi:hypothetical protein
VRRQAVTGGVMAPRIKDWFPTASVAPPKRPKPSLKCIGHIDPVAARFCAKTCPDSRWRVARDTGCSSLRLNRQSVRR